MRRGYFLSDTSVEWTEVDFRQILEEDIFKGMKFGYKYHKDMHLISIMKEGSNYSKLIKNVIENPMFRDCLKTTQKTQIAYLENEVVEERRRSKSTIHELMTSMRHIKEANEALKDSLKSLKPWYKRIF